VSVCVWGGGGGSAVCLQRCLLVAFVRAAGMVRGMRCVLLGVAIDGLAYMAVVIARLCSSAALRSTHQVHYLWGSYCRCLVQHEAALALSELAQQMLLAHGQAIKYVLRSWARQSTASAASARRGVQAMVCDS
jgi:hypothetical protein